VALQRLDMAQIGYGSVVDSELVRLFLVGWDVPVACGSFPVPSGVR
jgi:hypothetical protein